MRSAWIAACGNPERRRHVLPGNNREVVMRGVLLWALGIPIPILVLLYLFHVI